MSYSMLIAVFQTQVSVATNNRRFFITKNGYFGSGPSTTQPGDNVCFLFGGKVPSVVRKKNEAMFPLLADPEPESETESGGPLDTFELLGDGYVQGIMMGEFMDGKEWEQVVNEAKYFMFE